MFRRIVLAVVLTLACARVAHAQDPEHPMQSEGEFPKLRLTGFGNVDFSRQQHAAGKRHFSLGQFVLHMTSQLSTRVTFFGELSFTARTDAGTGTPVAPGFNLEVERMILRIDQSDQLRVSFGRYHTPINYWNTAYHHGAWLQTTIDRPEMIMFGGRFLPVHFIGALVEGTAPAGGWNIGYKAGFGNGRAQVISRGGDPGDVNGTLAYLASLGTKPDRIYGLEAGVSFYTDTITVSGSPEVHERIATAHLAYTKETPEFIAEYATVRHEQAGSGTVVSRAYYVQTGYRFEFDARTWKAYYRFEHIGIPSSDPVFSTIPLLDQSTIGLRYDASSFAAIKGEFRTWTRGPGTVRDRGGYFQVAFTF